MRLRCNPLFVALSAVVVAISFFGDRKFAVGEEKNGIKLAALIARDCFGLISFGCDGTDTRATNKSSPIFCRLTEAVSLDERTG